MPATTLTDRAVVRLAGEDVRGFVQGLVTSDVAGALPVWAGLLTPQGKCLFDFIVWDDGEDLLLDCEAAAADDLIKRLAIYRLRRPIRIERDISLAVHWASEGSDGVPDPRLAALGRRWLVSGCTARNNDHGSASGSRGRSWNSSTSSASRRRNSSICSGGSRSPSRVMSRWSSGTDASSERKASTRELVRKDVLMYHDFPVAR